MGNTHESKLAEVWQVVEDGQTRFVLRMPVDADHFPEQLLGQVVYADIVCAATQEALDDARSIVIAVTQP